MIRIEETGSRILIWRDEFCIAGNDDADLARAARWAMEIREGPGVGVLMLGLGTGNLVRLLHNRTYLTVIEREPEIIEWFTKRWPSPEVAFITGEYPEVLARDGGQWEYVIDDTGEETDYDLRPHVFDWGHLWTWHEDVPK